MPADYRSARLTAGQPFTPTNNGFFISDARMKMILDELDRARISGK